MNGLRGTSECLAVLAAGLMVFGCGDDDGGGYNAGGGNNGGGTGAVGGGTGAVGGGTGGNVSGGTGGNVSGGTGGNVSGGTGGNSGGTAAIGGGTGGTGGSSSGGGITADTCVADLVADNNSMECATCMCQAGTAGCVAELDKCTNDPLCAALVDCVEANSCSGDCCLCGAVCDPLGGNINGGACQQETGDAAGVGTPDAFLNGAMIEPACAAGTGNTPCAWSNELGDCQQAKCAAECGAPPSCP